MGVQIVGREREHLQADSGVGFWSQWTLNNNSPHGGRTCRVHWRYGRRSAAHGGHLGQQHHISIKTYHIGVCEGVEIKIDWNYRFGTSMFRAGAPCEFRIAAS